MRSRSRGRPPPHAATAAGAAERQAPSRKRYAWMDSGDEASGSDAEAEGEGPPRRAGEGPDRRLSASSGSSQPVSMQDVQTLSQLMRIMELWPRGKLLRMDMQEAAATLQAAARVRYYAADVFGDVTSAVKVHLRGRSPVRAEDIADVVSALADTNAYDHELFELAARSLNTQSVVTVERQTRKRIVEAFRKVNHQSRLPIIQQLAMQEKAARYEAACEEVAASWQKPGALSGAAMPLSL